MEFFAPHAEVERLQAQLAALRGPARLPSLAQLAWQLRQRDTRAALRLVQEIRQLLSANTLPPHTALSLQCRCNLIEGEAQWLYMQLDKTNQLVDEAWQQAQALQDAIASADICYLRSQIAHVAGDTSNRVQELNNALLALGQHDTLRQAIYVTMLAFYHVFLDADLALQDWRQHALEQENIHPTLACQIEFLVGTYCSQKNQRLESAQHFLLSYRHAIASGQYYLAIFAATNCADVFCQLNEAEIALEWLEKAVEMARRARWPRILAWCLNQTANCLRLIKRLDAAQAMLEEAHTFYLQFPNSYNFAVNLQYLGELHLAREAYPTALHYFQNMVQLGDLLRSEHLQGNTAAYCAITYAAMQQVEAANAAARQALDNPATYKEKKILMLLALAKMPNLPGSKGNSSLDYLLQALDISKTISGYSVLEELLDALAEEYAKLNQHDMAYHYTIQAKLAREKTSTQKTKHRALVVQFKHQTDDIWQENERHRELAENEAKRAEILLQTSHTLEHLSKIGQEITANLDAERVYQVLYRHICELIDATTVMVYLLNEDGKVLKRVFGMANGAPLGPYFIALQQENSNSALCVREQREILFNQDPHHISPYGIGNKFNTLSSMYAPLIVAKKTLGMMSIQTSTAYAYGTHEQLIFRTLCAYAATALGNASAHEELRLAHQKLWQSKQKLVLQEKMASLGTLTAGVAHEINNPTNFAQVAAQSLQQDLLKFALFVDDITGGEEETEPQLMQQFAKRFTRLQHHTETVLRGTQRITRIVKDLRNFTRLDEAAKKTVRLSQSLSSTLNLVQASWPDNLQILTDFQIDPDYDCWPALLNQVFMNLASNACRAIAKAERETGCLQIRMQLLAAATPYPLQIDFLDNGIGMSAAQIAHVLQGPQHGLGLAIARDIVKQHGGQLLLQSTPGEGSCISVCLPYHSRTQGVA